MHVALCKNFSSRVCSTDPVKVSKDAASLLVGTLFFQKKFFCLGGEFFCEWRHKWRTFRPPWPTLPGPGRQPLGGSISLKFLLETRLQSESFDTLDDRLGFRVQKLWCKLVKLLFILDHNFWTRNARKSIKNLKDSDLSLVSNENLSKTLWPSSWALGQATWVKMTLKLLHLWCQSQKIRSL